MTKSDSAIVVDLTKIPVPLTETTPIGFVRAEAPAHPSPLATLYYSVDGEERTEGLPIDFGKGVFLGNRNDEPHLLRHAILSLHGVDPPAVNLSSTEHQAIDALRETIQSVVDYAASKIHKERALGLLEDRAKQTERSGGWG